MNRKLYEIDEFPWENEHYYQLPDGRTVCHVELPPIQLSSESNQTVEEAMSAQRISWLNKEFVQMAITYGKYGWALFDNTTDEKFLEPIIYSIRHKSKTQAIDLAIDSIFTRHDLLKLHNELVSLFKDDSAVISKLDKAIKRFKRKQYYESALILFELVDSYSIKILKREQCNNTKQGLRSMSKVLKLKFGHLFGLHENNNPNSIGAHKELFEKLPEYVASENFENDFIAYEIINLAYSFKTLFDDCNWESTDTRPAAINRNYLMHGMYDYDDVQRYDCIKILFLLRKLLQVYSYDVE